MAVGGRVDSHPGHQTAESTGYGHVQRVADEGLLMDNAGLSIARS